MLGRVVLVFKDLVARRKSLLSMRAWKDVPWLKTCQPKSPFQALLDVFCDIPGLLEMNDELNRKFSSQQRADSSSIAQYETTVQEALARAFEWRLEWERSYGGIAYSRPTKSSLSQSAQEGSEPDTSDAIWFAQFSRAQEINLYNSILVFLLPILNAWVGRKGLLRCLESVGQLSSSAASHGRLALPHAHLTRETATTEIIRTTTYVLEGPEPRLGAYHLLLPLWSVYVSFGSITQAPTPSKDSRIANALLQTVIKAQSCRC